MLTKYVWITSYFFNNICLWYFVPTQPTVVCRCLTQWTVTKVAKSTATVWTVRSSATQVSPLRWRYLPIIIAIFQKENGFLTVGLFGIRIVQVIWKFHQLVVLGWQSVICYQHRNALMRIFHHFQTMQRCVQLYVNRSYCYFLVSTNSIAVEKSISMKMKYNEQLCKDPNLQHQVGGLSEPSHYSSS